MDRCCFQLMNQLNVQGEKVSSAYVSVEFRYSSMVDCFEDVCWGRMLKVILAF